MSDFRGFVEFGGPPCWHGSGINFFMRQFRVGSGKVTYGGGELCVCFSWWFYFARSEGFVRIFLESWFAIGLQELDFVECC